VNKQEEDVAVSTTSVPKAFGLSQNFPEPFCFATAIAFALPETTHVRLEIVDGLGQRVR
jgi:hypothetical protein